MSTYSENDPCVNVYTVLVINSTSGPHQRDCQLDIIYCDDELVYLKNII